MLLASPYYEYPPPATSPSIQVLQNTGTVQQQGNGTSITLTFSSNVTAGSTLIIVLEGYGIGSCTTPTTGGTWKQYDAISSGHYSSSSILVLPNAPAKTNSVTVGIPNWQNYAAGGMIEVAGLTNPATPDVQASYLANKDINCPFTSTATGSKNTAYANELAVFSLSLAEGNFGLITYSGNGTTAYTNIYDANNDNTDACGYGGYQILNTIQTPTVSVTANGSNSGAYGCPALLLLTLH